MSTATRFRVLHRWHTRLTSTARRRWSVTFGLLATLGVGWAVATPIFASPDEPSHVIRAWSVAHGEIIGSSVSAQPGFPNPFGSVIPPEELRPLLVVDAPGVYRGWGNFGCFAVAPQVSADCATLTGPDRSTRSLTGAGRYFPAPYAVFGLVTLASPPGAAQIYLMRVAGVLAAAAVLASAVMSLALLSRRPFGALGFVVALTPMTLFLMGTVNPSGLEIAAAIAMWTNASVLVARLGDGIDRQVLNRLGFATVVLVLVRPASPFVALACALVLLPIAGRRGVQDLWASRRARAWVLVVVALTGVHVAWNLAAGNTVTHLAGQGTDLTVTQFLRASLGQEADLLRQMIGVFGWLDTPAPTGTIVLWLAALGVVVGMALLNATRAWVTSIALAIGATILTPIALSALIVREVGFEVQGRYVLPIAVGIPIVAGVAAASTTDTFKHIMRLVAIVASALVVAQVVAFFQALRRYTVGANGPLSFVFDSRWNPPLPALVLLVLFAVACAAALAWIVAPHRAGVES